MNMYTRSVGMIVAVACSICLSDAAVGQVSSSKEFSRSGGSSSGRASASSRAFGNASGRAFGNATGRTFGNGRTSGNGGQDLYDRYGRRFPGTGFRQRSGTSASGSRSVSFTKDGNRVSISENAYGISVSTNGKTVRANNVYELKKNFPAAYRLYDEHIGGAQFGGSARASTNGSGRGGTGAPQKVDRASSRNRSVSVIDDGEKVSITEHKGGITVSINGKRVRAKNVAELKEKSPEAFRMYAKHLGGVSSDRGEPDASDLLQQELSKLRDENAANPRVKNLIERLMQTRNEGRDEEPNRPRSGFHQRSRTSVSGSRSVSFTKDGKRGSIKENGSGISVSINGESVQAKDVAELKEKYPDAYRLYDEHFDPAKFRSSARASANGSTGSGGGGTGSPEQISKSSSKTRSVSAMDNGKKVSITENKKGITVSMNGNRVRAKNVAELKEKSPAAFRMYEKHLGARKGHPKQTDATALLQEELSKFRDENADNPRVRDLIEKMIENVPQ